MARPGGPVAWSSGRRPGRATGPREQRRPGGAVARSSGRRPGRAAGTREQAAPPGGPPPQWNHRRRTPTPRAQPATHQHTRKSTQQPPTASTHTMDSISNAAPAPRAQPTQLLSAHWNQRLIHRLVNAHHEVISTRTPTPYVQPTQHPTSHNEINALHHTLARAASSRPQLRPNTGSTRLQLQSTTPGHATEPHAHPTRNCARRANMRGTSVHVWSTARQRRARVSGIRKQGRATGMLVCQTERLFGWSRSGTC